MIDDKFSYNAPFQVAVVSDREKEMYNTVSSLVDNIRNSAEDYNGFNFEIKSIGSILDMINKRGMFGIDFYFNSQVIGTLWFNHKIYGVSFDESWGLRMHNTRNPKESMYIKKLDFNIRQIADSNGRKIKRLRLS